MMKKDEPSVAVTAVTVDMWVGAEQIAAGLGLTVRQTRELLERKRLPAFKIGGLWRMRPSTWLAFVAKREAEAEALATAAIKPSPASAPRHSRRTGNRKAA